MNVREYMRVELDRVAELEAAGWKILKAVRWLSGHGFEVIMWRLVP